MSVTKDLKAFYEEKFKNTPPMSPIGTGDFNVFCLEDTIGGTLPVAYSRYDFFKIMLIRGTHRCHYADKSININGSTLLFFNPAIPYKFERLEDCPTGFFCVFKESFFTDSYRNGIHDLPLFTSGRKPIYDLDQSQDQEIVDLYQKMLNEINNNYRYKYDLLRTYVSEIIHFAMKIEPNEQLDHHQDANARITSIFIDLLKRQFPIESPESCIKMRSAKNFAEKLGLHVNHLNRAVRLTTGKTTTAHITEHLVAEATALLKHTDWNISEISFSLGFTEPSHFTYFFKKYTKVTPTSIRRV